MAEYIVVCDFVYSLESLEDIEYALETMKIAGMHRARVHNWPENGSPTPSTETEYLYL